MDIDWWSLRYESINSQLVCPICQTALVAPTTTPCGHTFCKKCIESLAETSEVLRCPLDRRTIDAEELKPAPFLVTGLCNDLIVYCPHEECSFKDKRWLLQSHIDLHCEYTMVECGAENPEASEQENKCTKLCERRWARQGCCHESIPCPNNCDQQTTLSELEDHLLVCAKATWECPDCGEQFVCSDKDSHIEECPLAVIACPGHKIGCPVEMTRNEESELKSHASSCPLALISPTLGLQQEKIESLERESQTLRRQLDTAKRQAKRDAANIDMHILMEYERMRTDLDHALTQNDSNMKQMMMLARENLQMSEEVGFLKTSLLSLRHQVHHSIQRRFNMPVYPVYVDGREREGRTDEPGVKL